MVAGFIARICQNSFDENSLVSVLHPGCSADLAPSDFWLFGHIKTSLAGHVFDDVDELLEAIIEFLNEIRSSELQLGLRHWIKRVKWILATNGDDYHEPLTYPEFVRSGPFWMATATADAMPDI
jgi:hypothetical protein